MLTAYILFWANIFSLFTPSLWPGNHYSGHPNYHSGRTHFHSDHLYQSDSHTILITYTFYTYHSQNLITHIIYLALTLNFLISCHHSNYPNQHLAIKTIIANTHRCHSHGDSQDLADRRISHISDIPFEDRGLEMYRLQFGLWLEPENLSVLFPVIWYINLSFFFPT